MGNESTSPPPRRDAKESKLLLKIDLLLMPLMTIAYGLQFYDKAILGSASIFGILKDMELSTVGPGGKVSLTRYSTATSAFYWGYLVAALPMALLVQKFKPSIFLGSAIVLWGSILLITPAITHWKGLVAQRFFLGFVESAVSPGFVLITRMWYKRDEQPVRLGIWYSATGLFSIFSGLVNYGLGKAGSQPGSKLADWKYMFLFAGSLTVVFGFILMVLLPASPVSDPILRLNRYNVLDGEERNLAVRRIRTNFVGSSQLSKRGSNELSEEEEVQLQKALSSNQTRWEWDQAKEAMMDYKVWIFFLQAISIYICNGGVTAFGAYIIKSFGYSSVRSIVLQTPGGATTALSIYLSTYLARRVPNSRSILLCLTCLPVMTGAILIWKGDWSNRAIPLAGYYLLPIFGAPFVLMLSLSTANIAGSTKQSITAAMIFVGYNVGNIVAPYLTKADQAKIHYRDTFVAIITCMCITIGLTALLCVGMATQNRKRKLNPTGGQTLGIGEIPAKVLEEEQEDRVGSNQKVEGQVESGEKIQLEKVAAGLLTDWENPNFRYVF
ncbi:MFS general substrate transporter [Violaceomyces palustris]|uniref:MFS general substrate transporter n=1 Tax=Violaceomyces palustris TaxID=1673888 RepID=A0ACD0NMP1_9BASI|nr:MFS general substrate transporter [Violaceomyces palustris]